MKTTETGRLAEAAVVEHLASKGHKILAQNWKTPVCEIDIVTQKDRIVYFVEVKFRAQDDFGGGFEHIGRQKLKQLDFAAKVWCQHHRYDGDCRILAAEVSGERYQDISVIEISG